MKKLVILIVAAMALQFVASCRKCVYIPVSEEIDQCIDSLTQDSLSDASAE